MSNAGNLWAVGFDEAERAAQVRDEITKLAWQEHCLILKDVEVAVRYPDGLFVLNGEPFHEMTEVPTRNTTSFLACLALGAPPMTGAAVGRLLDSFGFTQTDVGISDDFVRQIAHLTKPGTSVLFVLDDVGDLDAVLRSIRGLGGTVLKTSVDLERAQTDSVHTGGAERMTPETQWRSHPPDSAHPPGRQNRYVQ